jgi:hypothetical protein
MTLFSYVRTEFQLYWYDDSTMFWAAFLTIIRSSEPWIGFGTLYAVVVTANHGGIYGGVAVNHHSSLIWHKIGMSGQLPTLSTLHLPKEPLGHYINMCRSLQFNVCGKQMCHQNPVTLKQFRTNINILEQTMPSYSW